MLDVTRTLARYIVDSQYADIPAAVKHEAARVTVRLKDGGIVTEHVENALGTLARPMSDADLEAKCRGLTDGIIGASQTDELIWLCWSVATLPDAGAIARAATPAA